MALPIVPEAADIPGEAEVQAALARILASESFRTSPQLGVFLRFVVEAALGGRAASLKGYTIGVEALGRDPGFDPQLDPIVRVEATRLRRAMERYYAGAGSDDPVVIDLPRGSYVPTFTRRGAPAEPPLAPFPARVRLRSHGGAVAAILLFAALAVVAAAAAVARRRARADAHGRDPAAQCRRRRASTGAAARQRHADHCDRAPARGRRGAGRSARRRVAERKDPRRVRALRYGQCRVQRPAGQRRGRRGARAPRLPADRLARLRRDRDHAAFPAGRCRREHHRLDAGLRLSGRRARPGRRRGRDRRRADQCAAAVLRRHPRARPRQASRLAGRRPALSLRAGSRRIPAVARPGRP